MGCHLHQHSKVTPAQETITDWILGAAWCISSELVGKKLLAAISQRKGHADKVCGTLRDAPKGVGAPKKVSREFRGLLGFC